MEASTLISVLFTFNNNNTVDKGIDWAAFA
jgi:hypothetical protein